MRTFEDDNPCLVLVCIRNACAGGAVNGWVRTSASQYLSGKPAGAGAPQSVAPLRLNNTDGCLSRDLIRGALNHWDQAFNIRTFSRCNGNPSGWMQQRINMIEVTRLHKRFGHLLAVDDISFTLEPGEILGFLGPNGAGKSTTMKMITGFIPPSKGSVSIWGYDIETDRIEAQRQIGYLPEGTPAYEEMTPRSFLGFIAEVRGYGKSERVERIASVTEVMALESVLDQRIETLSKGFKRRVGLAQAIIHDPNVLILDEPTDGLDPNQKYQVREMIRGLSKDKIVIISTHILEEVAAVCTRAMIISNGKILSDCTPRELEEKSRYHQAVTLKVNLREDLSMIATRLNNLDEVKSVEKNELELLVIPEHKDGRLLPAITNLVKEEDWQLMGLFQEKGRLDEVFRSITEGGPHAGSN